MTTARMSVGELQRRAISRAIALGVAGEVERLAYGWYRVPSTTTPGQTYTVRVTGERYVCDCNAGRSQRPCIHAAAVLIRKLEHASRCRVTGPATPAGGEAPANVVDIRRRRAA